MTQNRDIPVTVLMCVYNGSQYLREAVESILSQTWEDFEVLIVDDGSTEPVRDLIESFRDSRIRFVRQGNMGLTRALNRGVALARGAYIARMDADDVSDPERLEFQLNEFRDRCTLDLVGAFVRIIDDRGHLLESKELITDPIYRLWRLQFHNVYVHGSIVLRRRAILEAGSYDRSFTCAQDYDLWTRISGSLNTSIVPRFLYSHRVRADGGQVSVRTSELQMENALRVSDRNLMASHPGLTSFQCEDVRAIYWKFRRASISGAGARLFGETLDGFCRRFCIEGEEKRRLQDRAALDLRRELEEFPCERDRLCAGDTRNRCCERSGETF
jgi:glycosyltransferase involved in cell wall biosynthesis